MANKRRPEAVKDGLTDPANSPQAFLGFDVVNGPKPNGKPTKLMENRLKSRLSKEELDRLFPSFEDFETAAQTQICNNDDGHISANEDGTLTARYPFPIDEPVNSFTILESPNGTTIPFASNGKTLESISGGETEETAKQRIQKLFDFIFELYGKDNLFFGLDIGKQPYYPTKHKLPNGKPHWKYGVKNKEGEIRHGNENEKHPCPKDMLPALAYTNKRWGNETKIIKPSIRPWHVRNKHGALLCALEIDLPECNLPIQDMLDGLKKTLQTDIHAHRSKSKDHWQIFFFVKPHGKDDNLFKGKVWKLPNQKSFPYSQTNLHGKPIIHYGNEIKGKPTDKLTLHGADRLSALLDFLYRNFETQGIAHDVLAKILCDERPDINQRNGKQTARNGKHNRSGRPFKYQSKAMPELENLRARIRNERKWTTVKNLASKAICYHELLTGGIEEMRSLLRDDVADYKPQTKLRALKTIDEYIRTHNESATYEIRISQRSQNEKKKEEDKKKSLKTSQDIADKIRKHETIIQCGNTYYQRLPALDNPRADRLMAYSRQEVDTELENKGMLRPERLEIFSLLKQHSAEKTCFIPYGPRLRKRKNGELHLNTSNIKLQPLPQHIKDNPDGYKQTRIYKNLELSMGTKGHFHFLHALAHGIQLWKNPDYYKQQPQNRVNQINGPGDSGKSTLCTRILPLVFNVDESQDISGSFKDNWGDGMQMPLLTFDEPEESLPTDGQRTYNRFLRKISSAVSGRQFNIKTKAIADGNIYGILFVLTNGTEDNSPAPNIADKTLARKVNLFYMDFVDGLDWTFYYTPEGEKQMKEDALYMRSYIENLDHPQNRYGLDAYHDPRAEGKVIEQRGAEDAAIFFSKLTDVLKGHAETADFSKPLSWQSILTALENADEQISKPLLKRISARKGPSAKMFKALMDTCQLKGMPIHVDDSNYPILYDFQPTNNEPPPEDDKENLDRAGKEIKETAPAPTAKEKEPAKETTTKTTDFDQFDNLQTTTMDAPAAPATPSQTTNQEKENNSAAKQTDKPTDNGADPATAKTNGKPTSALNDLKLLAKHGYLDKDETAFANEVLEIDDKQLTNKEKKRLDEIQARYTYCLKSLRSLQ